MGKTFARWLRRAAYRLDPVSVRPATLVTSFNAQPNTASNTSAVRFTITSAGS